MEVQREDSSFKLVRKVCNRCPVAHRVSNLQGYLELDSVMFEQLLQHLRLVALLLLQIVQFLLNCLSQGLLALLNRRQQILQGKER